MRKSECGMRKVMKSEPKNPPEADKCRILLRRTVSIEST